MASCIHVVAQSHADAVDDMATLSSDQPSARRELAAMAVHGLSADDAADRCAWVRFRRASAASLRGGREREQACSQCVPVSASSQSSQQAVSASTYRSQALADQRATVSASSQSSQQVVSASSQSLQQAASASIQSSQVSIQSLPASASSQSSQQSVSASTYCSQVSIQSLPASTSSQSSQQVSNSLQGLKSLHKVQP